MTFSIELKILLIIYIRFILYKNVFSKPIYSYQRVYFDSSRTVNTSVLCSSLRRKDTSTGEKKFNCDHRAQKIEYTS
jgi:hypothetical protein